MPPVYEWYRKGMALLKAGDVHAAATLLERAAEAEPDKRSIREALARAYFGARRFDDALEQFRAVLDLSPVEDYSHFGAGLCLGRLGRPSEAVEHLRIANVMTPGNRDYADALASCEARLRAQQSEGQPPR